MSLRLLPFVGLLLMATPSLAETTPPPADKADAAKTEEAAPAKTHSSSAENRQGKMLHIVGEAGLAIAPFPQEGLGVGYYFSPDLVAELSYVAGSTEFLDLEVTTSLIEARAKYFIGNSFYAIGGLGQRTIGFTADLDASSVGGAKKKVSVDTSSTGLSLGIGNHWQWSGFTLGCQWLGYFMPLSSSGDTDLDVDGVNEKDKKDLQDSIDNLGKTPSYQALRLYLGWTI